MSLIHSFIDLYRSLYNLDLLLIAVVVDFTTKGQICRKRAIHHMVYGASMMSINHLFAIAQNMESKLIVHRNSFFQFGQMMEFSIHLIFPLNTKPNR